MAWGGISKKGKTPLFCFTNIMDGQFYVNILQTQLLSAAQNMYRRNWHLQQDNDLKHISCVAKDFIARNSINIIDWPSNSLNLNPIGNVWTIMKNNVEKRMPKNISELTKFLTEEWDTILQIMINNLIMSMRTRCK
ncbi:transposable element Tcb1 transposase isoform X2 [Rhizophagus clarus]|uniref:Transposable element Tcb1 transposase isoform X2 n=1 Tax=Rhizophagus clarus TaxID=94130 RepID=A0A8H3MLG8_9GLOM|nr:transposable element Tcb1 transposase isoform X2 [Rhizophagus clarus]